RHLLSQARPFTREDLAAYMKATFAEEWEREKRHAHELPGDDEPTPLSDPSGSIPLIRPPPRPAEDTARRAVEMPPSPPPAPPDAEEPSLSRRPRPSRLAAAAQAAETERAHIGPAIGAEDDLDETTTTESEPRLAP